MIFYNPHSFRNGNAHKTFSFSKCIFSNSRNTVRYYYTYQILVIVECVLINFISLFVAVQRKDKFCLGSNIS